MTTEDPRPDRAADPPPAVVRHATPTALARQLNAAAAADADGVAGAPLPVFEPAPALAPPPPLLPLRARLAAGEAVPMLLFAVGGEAFLLPLADVREALDAPLVHPVPRMTGATRGVLALRGALLPVKDPSAILGVPAPAGAAALVVVGERPLVLLVDDVLDAVAVTADAVRPLPAGLPADDFVLGAAPAGGRLAALLDLPQLLVALDLSDR
jgi:chemotaxis signal transduction protein